MDFLCYLIAGINNKKGASFTFGCSYSSYTGGCKYGKAGHRKINKFKLQKDAPKEKEKENEDILQELATFISPIVGNVVPDAYKNMTAFESEAEDCRIGLQPGKPFSGITAVADFCAHDHKDKWNMDGGCTIVLTLTKPKNRQIESIFFKFKYSKMKILNFAPKV